MLSSFKVSRTRHFGIGINTKFMSTEKVFLTQPIAKRRGNDLTPLFDLALERWTERLTVRLKSAVYVSDKICKKEVLEELAPGTYLKCYRFSETTSNDNYPNHLGLLDCFHAWSYSFQGAHKYVSTVHFAPNKTFYLVAYPESPYSTVCPDERMIFDVHKLDKQSYMEMAVNSLRVKHLEYHNYKTPTREFIIHDLFQLSNVKK